jgi:hypothetical protein
MNWQDVLDQQLRLQRALTQGRVSDLAEMYRGSPLADEVWRDAIDRAAPAALAEAAPVYVAPEVAELWDQARPSFALDRFDESEPFVPDGFALLPRSYVLDASYPAPTRAVLWATFGPAATTMWGFALGEDVPDSAPTRGWACTWWNAIAANTHGDGSESSDTVAAVQSIRAFWRLGREFVAGTERAPRGQRRAARRAGLSADVTILRLRRHVRAVVEAGQARDWSCQWIVRGHWRNQWYPSLEEHRQRYVAPYIKGPQDKPLRVTDRAVEFIR